MSLNSLGNEATPSFRVTERDSMSMIGPQWKFTQHMFQRHECFQVRILLVVVSEKLSARGSPILNLGNSPSQSREEILDL